MDPPATRRQLPVSPARAGEALRYVRKATWLETLIASREVAARQGQSVSARVPLPDFGRSPFTVMAWLRTTRGGTLFAQAPAEGEWVPQGKSFFVRGGRLCFDIGWVACVTGRSLVDDGKWHHVAIAGGPSPQTLYAREGWEHTEVPVRLRLRLGE